MLKKFQDFLIYTNIFIGLAATAQSALFFQIHEIPFDYKYLAFVFFSTIVAYLFAVGYPNKSGSFKNPRIEWMNTHSGLVHGIMFLSASASAYTFLGIQHKVLIILTAGLTLLYHLPFENWGFKGFRSLPYLKVFIISFVWVMLCNVQIAIENKIPLQEIQYTRFALKFIWIIALTLPFDIRDFEQDKESNLKTIPSLIGVKGTQLVSILLFLFCMSMQMLINGFTAESITVICSSLVAIAVIANIHRSKGDFQYLVLLDGLLILQLPIFYITKYLL